MGSNASTVQSEHNMSRKRPVLKKEPPPHIKAISDAFPLVELDAPTGAFITRMLAEKRTLDRILSKGDEVWNYKRNEAWIDYEEAKNDKNSEVFGTVRHWELDELYKKKERAYYALNDDEGKMRCRVRKIDLGVRSLGAGLALEVVIESLMEN